MSRALVGSISFLVVLAHAYLNFHGVYARPFKRRDATFDWNSVNPSPTLDWVPCYQNFTCTKLEVPLDYANASAGMTGIAFIKFAPPGVSETAPNIIFNDGGPGGGGVSFITGFGPTLSQIVGGQYNIVSFDPRGIDNSGPWVDCFSNNDDARDAFEIAFFGETTNASSTSLASQFYASELWGRFCTEAIGRNNTSGVYVSTPAVAQDMLTYAQAEQEAAGLPEAEAKVWYYGLSYGTALGTTFASLFPNNVGRFVLDGVLDAEDYYLNGWKTNLYQADEALASFSTFCHQAGPQNCSFWGPSPQNITNRLDNVLAELQFNPIPVTSLDNSGSNTTGLATYSDLKTIMLEALYQPVIDFPTLSDALDALERGIGFDPSLAPDFLLGPDVNTMIFCVDGYKRNVNNFTTVQEYASYANLLISQSKYIGEAGPTNTRPALCRSLNVAIPESGIFKGPLPPSANNTSFPLLFVSTTVDPVTPIAGAYKMSNAFSGSSVLIQEGVGHTATAQGGSNCTFQHIQAYLDNGMLPAPNTTCTGGLVPFRDQSTLGQGIGG